MTDLSKKSVFFYSITLCSTYGNIFIVMRRFVYLILVFFLALCKNIKE